MHRRALSSVLRLSSLLVLAACSGSDLAGPDLRTTRLAAVPVRNPVIFIHGWNSTGAAWFSTIDRLKADGYQASELHNWTYYSTQSNAITAQQLSAKVDSILAITGATQVDLVTHSMGIMSARYYIKNLKGAAKVDAVISLGGTNHGTNTAIFLRPDIVCGDAAELEFPQRPQQERRDARGIPLCNLVVAMRRSDQPAQQRSSLWRNQQPDNLHSLFRFA